MVSALLAGLGRGDSGELPRGIVECFERCRRLGERSLGIVAWRAGGDSAPPRREDKGWVFVWKSRHRWGSECSRRTGLLSDQSRRRSWLLDGSLAGASAAGCGGIPRYSSGSWRPEDREGFLLESDTAGGSSKDGWVVREGLRLLSFRRLLWLQSPSFLREREQPSLPLWVPANFFAESAGGLLDLCLWWGTFSWRSNSSSSFSFSQSLSSRG